MKHDAALKMVTYIDDAPVFVEFRP
jgi:hypothetical protein